MIQLFRQNRNSKKIGLTLIIISSIAFGIMPSAISYCYTQGVTPAIALLSRYILLVLIFLPRTLRNKQMKTIYCSNFLSLLLLSFFSAATPLLLFNAYTFLPTGITTTIHFMYPVVVVVLCALLFRERLSGIKAVCFVLCVSGILLTAGGWSGQLSRTGLIITILSSITWGSYIVTLNKTGFEGLNSENIIFFESLHGTVGVIVYGFLTSSFSTTITPNGWLALLGISFVDAVFGSLFFAMGVRFTDAQTSAIISTLEPITSILAGIVFMHESVTFLSLLGAALILSSVILLARNQETDTK